MDGRIPYSFGSILILVGAFGIGSVLHEAFVKGAMDISSPIAVFGIVAGCGLIVAGRHVERRFDPSEYVDAEEGSGEEDEFDEDISPIQSEWLEGRERDESYEE